MSESMLLFAKGDYKLYYFSPKVITDKESDEAQEQLGEEGMGVQTGKFLFTNGEIKFELEMEEALYVVHLIKKAANLDFDLSSSMHGYCSSAMNDKKEEKEEDKMFS